ncbi:MAG TPA: sigma-70 family RNA polymerase sigma factor [Phycisphaerae bacterium]|jgi:RNA polymerase sigma-70 factor (ECF subfamily)
MNDSLRTKRGEDLVLPHLPSIYRLARHLADDETDADDLVQETCLRALRAVDQFELRACGPKPWLLKILHNVFYTRCAAERRRPAPLDDATLDGTPPMRISLTEQACSGRQVNWDLFDERVKAAVAALAPEFREVLLLWALEDLSYKEIAAACGCPLGTVMSRLHRARQVLMPVLREVAVERNMQVCRAA